MRFPLDGQPRTVRCGEAGGHEPCRMGALAAPWRKVRTDCYVDSVHGLRAVGGVSRVYSLRFVSFEFTLTQPKERWIN